MFAFFDAIYTYICIYIVSSEFLIPGAYQKINKWINNEKYTYFIYEFRYSYQLAHYLNEIKKILFYILLPITRESIVFESNFRNWDFDGFTRFEISWIRKSRFQ